MYDKAFCPTRVVVGLFQHLRNGHDKDALELYRKTCKSYGQNYDSQIRVIAEYDEDARGVHHARAIIDKNLFKGEKYYLVVDSHTMFEKHWDVKLI